MIIEVEDLNKTFDEVTALDSVSFTVNKGELFGFLGPNGAGKTTTINLLTGLARADRGCMSIADVDLIKKPRGAQHLIGVVPDESNLYPELSGYDNLCFCGALYGMEMDSRQKRARELLQKFELTDAAHRRFAGYSKGMKRKLTIAAGIIHQPEILFLDEPTTGIDVASARQVRKLIDELHREGTTIFLTTHYIEEAERLCDRIAFIVKGRIIRIDSVENLLKPVHQKKVLEISFDDTALGEYDRLKSLLSQEFPDLASAIKTRAIRPSLEDVFVDITGIETQIMNKERGSK